MATSFVSVYQLSMDAEALEVFIRIVVLGRKG